MEGQVKVVRTSVLPTLNANSSSWVELGQLLGTPAFMMYPKEGVGLERELLRALSQMGPLCLPEIL